MENDVESEKSEEQEKRDEKWSFFRFNPVSSLIYNKSLLLDLRIIRSTTLESSSQREEYYCSCWFGVVR